MLKKGTDQQGRRFILIATLNWPGACWMLAVSPSS
jgi:hypothetical protein